MTDKEKEVIKFIYNLRATIDESIMLFDEGINVRCGKETIKQITTALNLIQNQQAEIENYKKQKIYDEQFKHELLEEIRCKGLTIDSLNKILDDRLICIQGGRGLYAKLKGLDKEHLIREYLSMYKMCKAELEKKDKMIDEIQKEVRDHIGFENILKRDNKEPDLFNQGRFYVANNINNILKGKVENGN